MDMSFPSLKGFMHNVRPLTSTHEQLASQRLDSGANSSTVLGVPPSYSLAPSVLGTPSVHPSFLSSTAPSLLQANQLSQPVHPSPFPPRSSAHDRPAAYGDAYSLPPRAAAALASNQHRSLSPSHFPAPS